MDTQPGDAGRRYEEDFGPPFLRKVLALAIRTGLHQRVPGALLPAHFAPPGGRLISPHHRLALILEAFEKTAPREWPGVETMDLLVERDGDRLGADERAVLTQEWAVIRALEVPDPTYVERELREWAARQGLQRAMLRAGDLYQRGAPAAEVRTFLLNALRSTDPASGRVVGLIETYRERVGWWERGEDRGRRVPTGFGPLDRALDGGVRLGETFFALGSPKGGKSTFLINLALNAVRRRFGAVLFSYEMGERPMLLRMDRNVAHASRAELRADPRLLDRVYRGLIAAGAGELWLWTGAPPKRNVVADAFGVVEEVRRGGHPVDTVLFDFLNAMGGGTGHEREKRHELAALAREISEFGKALETATWSASLVRREAVSKVRVRKTDIAESYEVVAVGDGLVGICAPEELLVQGKRSLYLTALRESQDEAFAGVYNADLDRMTFVESQEEDAIPEDEGG